MKKYLKMKRVLFALVILTSSLVGISQSNSKTFNLKNGSVITGVVVEEKPGKEYKIKTTDGNIFVFKADEIEKITLNQEASKKSKNSEEELADGTFFYNLNELSLGGMFYDNGDATYNVGLGTINGVNFNNQLFIGLGVEFQTTGIGNFVPVYLDLRLNFNKTSKTFFTFLNAGMAISGRNEEFNYVQVQGWSSNNRTANIKYENGFLGRLGFGYKAYISDKLDATVSLFYTANSYKTNTWLYGETYFKAEGFYSILGVKLGIGIK